MTDDNTPKEKWEPKSPKDRRKDKRVSFKTQIVLMIESEELLDISTTDDISMAGLFVKTDHKIPVGTPCTVELVFKGVSTKTSININGTIARQAKDGLGISFDEIEVDSYFHLNNFLKHTILDPKTIQQEIFPID